MYLLPTGNATDFYGEVAKLGKPGESWQERNARYGRNIGLASLPVAGLYTRKMWRAADKVGPHWDSGDKLLRRAGTALGVSGGLAAGGEAGRQVIRFRSRKKRGNA